MKSISLILCAMFLTIQDKRPLLYDVYRLADIPDRVGFAGSIGGVSNGVLITAGGSNFPEGTKPWAGGIKKWYKDIYILKTPEGLWEKAGTLPQNLGYTVSVSYKDVLICAGGSNEYGHSDKVFGLRWNKKAKAIETEYFTDLPFTLANASAEVVGDKLFIAGGLQSPESREALNTFLMLDLSKPDSPWEILPSWPGLPRMLSVSASYEDRFFLFSGTNLVTDSATGSIKRKYLNDGYVYSDKTKDWKVLSPMEAPAVASVGPAPVEKSRILILGGDNGQLAESALQDSHPGFGNSVQEYNIVNDSWSKGQDFPIKIRENVISSPNESDFLPVTAPLVKWNGGYALIGGEVRPGTRTPGVYFIKMK